MDEMALIISMIAGAVLIVPARVICRKSGHSPVLALVVFLPLVGLPVLALFLAFAPWRRATESMFPLAIMGLAASEVLFLGFAAICLWVVARIIRKAGYSWWWSLLLLIPVVNIVMVWVFAFARWPDQELQK